MLLGHEWVKHGYKCLIFTKNSTSYYIINTCSDLINNSLFHIYHLSNIFRYSYTRTLPLCGLHFVDSSCETEDTELSFATDALVSARPCNTSLLYKNNAVQAHTALHRNSVENDSNVLLKDIPLRVECNIRQEAESERKEGLLRAKTVILRDSHCVSVRKGKTGVISNGHCTFI